MIPVQFTSFMSSSGSSWEDWIPAGRKRKKNPKNELITQPSRAWPLWGWDHSSPAGLLELSPVACPLPSDSGTKFWSGRQGQSSTNSSRKLGITGTYLRFTQSKSLSQFTPAGPGNVLCSLKFNLKWHGLLTAESCPLSSHASVPTSLPCNWKFHQFNIQLENKAKTFIKRLEG